MLLAVLPTVLKAQELPRNTGKCHSQCDQCLSPVPLHGPQQSQGQLSRVGVQGRAGHSCPGAQGWAPEQDTQGTQPPKARQSSEMQLVMFAPAVSVAEAELQVMGTRSSTGRIFWQSVFSMYVKHFYVQSAVRPGADYCCHTLWAVESLDHLQCSKNGTAI